jgi:hypothetical protein
VAFPPDPAPTDDNYGKSLSLAFRGALFGCIGVGVVSGVMGVWPLFFAFPPLTVHLVLSALLGAALTALITRARKRALSAQAVMAMAAALTFVFFAALPFYLFFHRSSWAGGLLFN